MRTSSVSIVGLVIVVIAVLLMLAKALSIFHGIALIWLILLLVLGAALWLYGGRYPSRRV